MAPPVPGAPVFSSQNHFGTMRVPPSQSQSQETISGGGGAAVQPPPVNGRPIGKRGGFLQVYKRSLNINAILLPGRPTVAPPPRPPPNKPPPPPLRSVSNQNLPQMPLSTPTTNTLNSAASVNNVSVLKEQLKHQIPNGGGGSASSGGSTPNIERAANGGGGAIPPPLPPHRTGPAPPPPNANRSMNNVSVCFTFAYHSPGI